jgi:hypothetical protein
MKMDFARRLLGLLAAAWCSVAAPSHATTIIYDVNFSTGADSVTGTITTNGQFGALLSTDITAWSFVIKIGPNTGIAIGSNPTISGTPLLASSSVIDFEPSLGTADFVDGPVDWLLLGAATSPPLGAFRFDTSLLVTDTVPITSSFLRDIPVAVAESPTPTPIPAAFPMFIGGAGLIGLLARRRKRMNLNSGETVARPFCFANVLISRFRSPAAVPRAA